MRYQKQIERYIDTHKNALVKDVCELCNINSERMPSEDGMPFGPGAADCLDVALDMAESYGFEVKDYDGYVGCVDLNDRPRQLDILAHLDVVPAGEGWTVTEAFRPVVRDGRIYGRGTSDDKGPAIAALYAMRAVKACQIPLKKNVRLILGTNEECGSSDIEHYYKLEKEAPMSFSPDSEYPVINIEKGRLASHFTAGFEASESLPRLVSLKAGTKINVVPGRAEAVVEGFSSEELNQAAASAGEETGISFSIEERGTEHLIFAKGVGAHGSLPEEGKNAITGLLSLLTRLPFAPCAQADALKGAAALFPHGDHHGTALGIDMEDDLSGRLSLTFSMLEIGAENFDGAFDARVPLCGNEDNVLKVAARKLEEAGFALQNKEQTPPHHVPGDSSFVQTLLKCYEHYTGLKGGCKSTGGGTYVHNLKNGVAFGACFPGTDPHMHGPDEFVVIDQLAESAKIFAQVIVELCS